MNGQTICCTLDESCERKQLCQVSGERGFQGEPPYMPRTSPLSRPSVPPQLSTSRGRSTPTRESDLKPAFCVSSQKAHGVGPCAHLP